MVEVFEPSEVDDPGPEEPPENPVTRREDLWLLGEHRLLCGDSTSTENMQRLVGEERPSLLATEARMAGTGRTFADVKEERHEEAHSA